MPWAIPPRAQVRELAPTITEIEATITEIEATIAAATTAITSIAELADADRAAAVASVGDALKPLGAKVIPTVSEEQGRAWLVAVEAGLERAADPPQPKVEHQPRP